MNALYCECMLKLKVKVIFFVQNIWRECKFTLPLHPLSVNK